MTTIKMKDIINNDTIMILKRKPHLLSAKHNKTGNAKYHAVVWLLTFLKFVGHGSDEQTGH